MKKEFFCFFIVTLLLVSTGLTVAGSINEKRTLDNQYLFVDDGSSESYQLSIGTVTVKELVHGSPIDGANGMKIGPDGYLYIASSVGREIVVMDPANGKIIERIGQEKGVEGPDDLVFGPDGSLYWTDILTGYVGRIKPDGTYIKQYVATYVNPIAFNDEGRLFVAQAFVNDGLFELDPELIDPPNQIMGVGNPALSLNGFDFGPDGLIYAPRSSLDEIVSINVDTFEVEVVTNEADGACVFDSNGELYTIADGSRVVKCDVDSGECTTVVDIEPFIDNLAFDSEGQLYASNWIDGSIYKIKKYSKFQKLSGGGLIAPGGIAVLPNGHAGESIFIADFWTVKEYDGLTGKAGKCGLGFFFDAPFTAAPDGENLILSSWFGYTVEVWNPASNDILETYYFDVPMNAVRFQDDLVVAELGSHSVVCQDHVTGGRTILASGLIIPTGLAYTDDDLWVAEWYNGVVYQIVADGIVQNQPITVATGLSYPEGLTVDKDGNLLVVESGSGQLTQINPDTGDKTVLADGLAIGETAPSGFPPTWLFNGVAIGERGDIYVTGDAENLVYRIRVVPPNPSFPIFNWLFERFPNMFPVLQKLIGFS